MTYRDRRVARAERLRRWAATREERQPALSERAQQMRDVIPMGQPIFVGHHSESRHRRHLQRSDRAEERAIENQRTAVRMRRRAESIEQAAEHAIYEDDPDALELL